MSDMHSITADQLAAACRALVKVEFSSLGLEVQLPVIYPNGDLATVVVAEEGDHYVAHDGGFAAMLLAGHGVGMTNKLRAKVESLSAHYGCAFVNDRMVRRAEIDTLPLAVAVVANASRTIADQLLETRNQPMFSFRREVIERVKEFVGSSRVREDEEVFGYSGTPYHVGAVILDKTAATPIALVEAVKDRDGVDKRFREFFDISLSETMSAPDRIVLYDERARLQQGDLIVLQKVSNVVRFSDAEARLKSLAA